MDESKKQRITELAKKAHDARVKHECLSMMNSNHGTYEEKQQRSVDYAIAQAEMFEAQSALDKEIKGTGDYGKKIDNFPPSPYIISMYQPQNDCGLSMFWPFG